MKLSVCMVAPLPPPCGGIGRWTTLVYNHALVDFDVAMMIVDISPKWRAIYNNSYFVRSFGGSIQFVRDAFRLVSILLSHRFSVIHLVTSGSLASLRDVALLYIAKLFALPVVYHIHFGRIPDISSRDTWEWKIMKFVISRVHTTIAIDGPTYTSIMKYTRSDRVVLIPNCIDPSVLPKAGHDNASLEKTVVFIGWVVRSKGIDELFSAWSQINTVGWRLLIVGPCDSNYREDLTNKWQHKNVDFLGELSHDQAMNILSRSDLFVLPSHTEAFPNVILEAMVFGKAIVATDVGAIPEMLANNCGVLVHARDSTALGNAMFTVMNNESMRLDIGGRAMMQVNQKYSIDNVFGEYRSIWETCNLGRR